MSLTARFYIEGHEKGIKILSCDFSYSQDVDDRGMGASKIRAGLIHISIPGTNDTDLLEWMLGRDTRKKCSITFSGFIDTGQQRSIEFEDALLVNYHETFSDPLDIVIHLTISSRLIRIKGVTYERKWTPPENY